MKKHLIVVLAFSAALSCLLVSCNNKKQIVFDDSDPLSLATDIEWAVVKEPYVAFRIEPGFENEVMNYGRVGEIVMVLGKKYIVSDGTETIWYEFDKGWLDMSCIVVYDNKLKAKSASEKLLK